MKRPKGLFALDPTSYDLIYGPEERRDIEELCDIIAPTQTAKSLVEKPDLVAQLEVIFSGWGAPPLTDRFLDTAGELKVLFYGAGAVGGVATDAAWDRGVVITSAYGANAIPVAQYTLAVLFFSLKHGWHLSARTRQTRSFPPRDHAPGCYGSTVGLISLGMIGRTVLRYLAPFDLKTLIYDPFLTASEAKELGVERVSLEALFERSDAVSVHTPSLPETAGMITGAHLAAMKQGATFINTARGQVVREDELIEVAQRRADLQIVLDVTAKEPPDESSPLYTLPNVVLTPHIAGSVGQECRRMGRFMVEELRRYVTGRPMEGVITRELAQWSSHRPTTAARMPKVRIPKPEIVTATPVPARR